MDSQQQGSNGNGRKLDIATEQRLMNTRRYLRQIIKQSYMALNDVEEALDLPQDQRLKLN